MVEYFPAIFLKAQQVGGDDVMGASCQMFAAGGHQDMARKMITQMLIGDGKLARLTHDVAPTGHDRGWANAWGPSRMVAEGVGLLGPDTGHLFQIHGRKNSVKFFKTFEPSVTIGHKNASPPSLLS